MKKLINITKDTNDFDTNLNYISLRNDSPTSVVKG